MRIDDGHCITESGVTFIYDQKNMTINWEIPGTEINGDWSVEDEQNGCSISRVSTEIDMQTELSWFLFHNPELTNG